MEARILMCAPTFFEVAYVINPWMRGNVALANRDLAQQQWDALARAIGTVATVDTLPPASGVPDMVFTANAGVVLGQRFVRANFRHAQRKSEEPHFDRWFQAHGYTVLHLPPAIAFEGAGDALRDRALPLLWLGYGHRSDLACAPLLRDWLGIDVEPLYLVDERFYHLDTCFCPLEDGSLLYYPPAFDHASQERIADLVPASRRVPVDRRDAENFACNAVNIGRDIYLNRASASLVERLETRGFRIHQTPLDEFMKAGGAAKCLTLRLDEPPAPGRKVGP